MQRMPAESEGQAVNDYVAGQRIKVEVEGKIGRVASGYIELVPDMGDTWGISLDGSATITVLAEPRPDEPKGLGAVVEAACVHVEDRQMWIRDQNENWRSQHGSPDDWDSLIDPVVKSHGWTADE